MSQSIHKPCSLAVVDITEQILNNEFPSDPEFIKDRSSIKKLLERDELKAKTSSNDVDKDPEYDETIVEEYLPSAVDITDANHFERVLKFGRFREDEPDRDLEASQRQQRISQIELQKLASHPALKKFLSKMRPEQITRKMVDKLLGTTSKPPLYPTAAGAGTAAMS